MKSRPGAITGKKHKNYNLKDADLPKGEYIRGNEDIKEQLHHDLNHWHSIGSHWIMAIGEIRKFFRILSDGNILTKLKE